MNKHPYRLVLTVLILGYISDYLFWKQGIGINFAIFAVLTLLAGFGLLYFSGDKPAKMSMLLLIPFVFFAIMSFCRREPLTQFLTYTSCLFAIGILAVSYTGGQWIRYNLLDYIEKASLLVASLVVRPVMYFVGLERQSKLETEEMQQSKVPFAAIARGVLIALPILALFTWLLASADLVFQQKLIDLQDDDLFERFLLILLVGYLLMGAFLHVATKSRDEKLIGLEKPIFAPFLGFTESAIVMGSVTLLFLTFVGIQFQYFFGGYTEIGVDGYTYSEYARRGFSELVIVVIINLLMIIGLSMITKRESNTQRKIFSGLSLAIVVQVVIMLVSAFMRLSLAVDWHGFSRLRVYPQVFMIWLGILLVAIAVLEVYRRERYFTLAIVLTCLGFSATLSLMNVDASIVHHNTQRTVAGKHFNVTHLANLSLDALPALSEEFQVNEYSIAIHEGIGAAMVCYWHSEEYADALGTEWRSFNLSDWRAGQAIAANYKALLEYKANIDGSLIRVQGPSGIWYECSGEDE